MTGLSLQGRSFPFSNGFLMLLVCLFYGELFRFNGEQQLPQAIYAAWGSFSLSKKEYHFVKMHQNHFVKFTTPHVVSNTWKGSFLPYGQKSPHEPRRIVATGAASASRQRPAVVD